MNTLNTQEMHDEQETHDASKSNALNAQELHDEQEINDAKLDETQPFAHRKSRRDFDDGRSR